MKKKQSYFAYCERDQHGRCLPSDCPRDRFGHCRNPDTAYNFLKILRIHVNHDYLTAIGEGIHLENEIIRVHQQAIREMWTQQARVSWARETGQDLNQKLEISKSKISLHGLHQLVTNFAFVEGQPGITVKTYVKLNKTQGKTITSFCELIGDKVDHRITVEKLPPETESFSEAGKIYLDERTGPVRLAGLLGRVLDNHQSRVLMKSFEEKRFGSEEMVDLSVKFPEAGFPSGTMGRADNLEKLFPGEPHRAFAAGIKNADGTTNLFRTGLELLCQDAPGFAAADPEFFNATMTSLQPGFHGVGPTHHVAGKPIEGDPLPNIPAGVPLTGSPVIGLPIPSAPAGAPIGLPVSPPPIAPEPVEIENLPTVAPHQSDPPERPQPAPEVVPNLVFSSPDAESSTPEVPETPETPPSPLYPESESITDEPLSNPSSQSHVDKFMTSLPQEYHDVLNIQEGRQSEIDAIRNNPDFEWDISLQELVDDLENNLPKDLDRLEEKLEEIAREHFPKIFRAANPQTVDIVYSDNWMIGERTKIRVSKGIAYISDMIENGHHIDHASSIKVDYAADGRAYYDPEFSVIYTEGSGSPEIAAHEYGHHLEENPKIREKMVSFQKKRTANTPTVKLAEKFPRDGFDANETGNADDFEKLFEKGSAQPYYIGKVYDSGATEILSMGCELLYRNPLKFAKLDPEYFNLVMETLKSNHREAKTENVPEPASRDIGVKYLTLWNWPQHPFFADRVN